MIPDFVKTKPISKARTSYFRIVYKNNLSIVAYVGIHIQGCPNYCSVTLKQHIHDLILKKEMYYWKKFYTK